MSALPRYLNRDLLAAAESDDLDGVKSLTAKTEQTPWTKLLCAATSNGSTAVAEYCLQSGARVDDEVMSWVMNSRASEPVYRLLIERKAIVIDFVIDRMGTMLGVCAVHGRDSMARFALEHGANPDRSVDCCMGRSPLACAAMYSHKSTIELLLDHGAKVKGSGALVVAAERGDLECARHLIARGADLNEIGVLTDPERSAAQAGTGESTYQCLKLA